MKDNGGIAKCAKPAFLVGTGLSTPMWFRACRRITRQGWIIDKYVYRTTQAVINLFDNFIKIDSQKNLFFYVVTVAAQFSTRRNLPLI